MREVGLCLNVFWGSLGLLGLLGVLGFHIMGCFKQKSPVEDLQAGVVKSCSGGLKTI